MDFRDHKVVHVAEAAADQIVLHPIARGADHRIAVPGGHQPVTLALLALHPLHQFRHVGQMRAQVMHHRKAGGDLGGGFRRADDGAHAAANWARPPIMTRFHRLIMPISTSRLATSMSEKTSSPGAAAAGNLVRCSVQASAARSRGV